MDVSRPATGFHAAYAGTLHDLMAVRSVMVRRVFPVSELSFVCPFLWPVGSSDSFMPRLQAAELQEGTLLHARETKGPVG